MNEVAISMIRDYMDQCLFEPSFNWPGWEFDRRIYSRWAANEILERVTKNPMLSPIDAIDQFMDEMDDHSEVSDDRNFQFIFIIARETAEDIGLLFV